MVKCGVLFEVRTVFLNKMSVGFKGAHHHAMKVCGGVGAYSAHS
jgi:hypothetical protein